MRINLFVRISCEYDIMQNMQIALGNTKRFSMENEN